MHGAEVAVDPLAGTQFHLVNSVEMAGRFMTWLGERHGTYNAIAIDTETSGLNFKRDVLRLVQFGDAMQGWAIPWERWGGVVEEAFAKLDPSAQLILHNAPFDSRFIEEHTSIKMPWSQMNDTLVMAHLLDPVLPVGLKPLSARYISPRAVAGQRVLDEAMVTQKWTWGTVPIDFGPYWAYAAMDTMLTARLYDRFRPQIDASFHDVYELEMGTRRIATAMEVKGARIDVGYTEAKLHELTAYVESCRSWVQENHGVHIGSLTKVAQRLIELGYPLTETTGSGAWKLDKEVLQGIIGLDDRDNRIFTPENVPASVLASLVYASRKSQKICSTYLENFLNMHDDEILRPSINTLGARTGRMSITQPALQTLPRGNIVRNCIIPREGNKIVSCDYAQIEARLVAHFSGDPGLVRAFEVETKTGVDFFTTVARDVNNDHELTKKDVRRQWTKNAFYALLYGAGLEKMSVTAKVEVEQMRAVLDGIHRAYPGIKQFQHRVEMTAAGRYATDGEAYVIDPFGRKQVVEDSNASYKLTNYLVQGTAAGVLKRAMLNMDMLGLGEYMILPVHDEILFDIPQEDLADALPLIKQGMEGVGDWLVPLTADPEVMDRWSKE